MGTFDTIEKLVFGLVPPLMISVGPVEIINALTLTSFLIFEWRTWRKYR